MRSVPGAIATGHAGAAVELLEYPVAIAPATDSKTYPPPTKCTISIRSPSARIVVAHSARRATFLFSSIAILAGGSESCRTRSSRLDPSGTSWLSPFSLIRNFDPLVSGFRRQDDLSQFGYFPVHLGLNENRRPAGFEFGQRD